LRGSDLRDFKYAFFILIEAPETIAVVRRNVEGVDDALAPFVEPWAYEALGGLYVDADTADERISLQSMSLGRNVVRRRSIEADNLAQSMPVAGVHRSIPSNFRRRSKAGVHTVGLGTNRVSKRDTRCSLDDIVRWVRRTGSALSTAAQDYSNTFLAQFCRAVPLQELQPDATPNAILFDFSELRESWESAPGDYQFSLAKSARAEDSRPLSEAAVRDVFEIGGQVFTIVGEAIQYQSPRNKTHDVGIVRINKYSIAVRSHFLDRVRVETPTSQFTLGQYANRESNFLITFSKPEFGYCERRLFQDGALLGSIDSLLQLFEPHTELRDATGEKHVSLGEFGDHGIFQFVERSLPLGPLLVCDDLGDEWADYIGCESAATRSVLTFVHCKHSDLSTSASALQVPIGQATKNLSRMHRGFDAFAAKVDAKWSTNYEDTSIERIRRGGDPDNIKAVFKQVLGNPNTERVVALVLSGVSLASVAEQFAMLRAGSARPHVSQLLWILVTCWSSCREHGVRLRILCQP
jgi:hypothetical protein